MKNKPLSEKRETTYHYEGNINWFLEKDVKEAVEKLKEDNHEDRLIIDDEWSEGYNRGLQQANRNLNRRFGFMEDLK